MSNDPGGSFDFGTVFEPERPTSAPGPAPTTLAPSNSGRAAGSFGGHEASSTTAKRRGQGLAWIAFALALASAIAIGFGIFLALDSIKVTMDDPFRDAHGWMTVVTLGLCVGVLAFAGGIVSEVRARPRTVATTALVGSLVLPLIALILGAKFGLDSLSDHVADDIAEIRNDTLVAMSQSIEDGHLDWLSLIQLLLQLLG